MEDKGSAVKVSVIPVTHDHIAPLTNLLLDVFADDSFFIRAFVGPNRHERMRRHFTHSIEEAIDAGMAYTRPHLDSVALWKSPTHPHVARTDAPAEYRAIIEQLTPYAPAFPALYLNLLATAPSARGQGAASALVSHLFPQADAHRWPIYLETQIERNLTFYGKLGFNVTQRIDAINGLPLWGMLRIVHP